MDQTFPPRRSTLTSLLALPLYLGSIIGAIQLQDGWLRGRSDVALLVWLPWFAASYLALRRMERSVLRQFGAVGVGAALGILCSGAVKEHALFGDTTWSRAIAAAVGTGVGMGAMQVALFRSDKRRREDARPPLSAHV